MKSVSDISCEKTAQEVRWALAAEDSTDADEEESNEVTIRSGVSPTTCEFFRFSAKY